MHLSRIAFSLALVLPIALAGQAPSIHYERSGCLETPRLEQTLEDCRALAKASPWIKVTSFGTSPQGRPLPLVIVDKDGHFDAQSARSSGKVVVMIQACIHAGEPEGKDAGLLFLRDLAVTKRHARLLDRLTFLFLPVFNVDGHERFSAFNRINQNGPKEMGWRTTASNLNLNRDYLKADAPEMRAWLKLYRDWLPDFFVDCHTTDGADYQYVLTYGVDTGHFTEARLGRWMRETYVAGLEQRMNRQGMLIFPYVSFREWHDPRSGLVGAAPGPMYSTGYQSAQNRASILLETHMLKPYGVRVEATRAALLHTAEILYGERDALLRLNREADAYTASAAFREQPMALAFVDDGVSEPVAFKGFEYTIEKSALTGGDWFKYDNTRPAVFQIPYFRTLKATASARLPEAYIVPAEWSEVIARLDAHGIRYHRLKSAQTVAVRSWRFEGVRWSPGPVEGRMKPDAPVAKEVEGRWEFPAGSAVVPTDQRTARLVAHLLEPASEDSLLQWGFFNAIFEQKEYGESYVMEGLAREMLAKDPALKAEFEKRRAEDKAFAASPWAMVNWFYQRSPYGDPKLNVYPVGRVMDAETARALMKQ